MRGVKAKKIRKEIRRSIQESDKKDYLVSLEEENRRIKKLIDEIMSKKQEEVNEELPEIMK